MTEQQAIEEIECQVCDGCGGNCDCCAFKMAKDALATQKDKE